nr:hypothetical protein [uncultured Rhodoferax sp.]
MKSISKTKSDQKGISLFLVLIVLLLTLSAVLGSFRVSSLNESILANTSDYSRAQAAAEALIRDAEIDIRGRRPPYTTVQADGKLGWPCRPNPATSTTTNVETVGYESSCRQRNSTTTPWFPQNNEEFDAVTDIVVANDATKRCENGICMPSSTTSHANIASDLASWTPFGATYGQYTRNSLAAPGVAGNPILTSATPSAWYWIEAFRYSYGASIDADISSNLIPSEGRNFIYRITAIAQGLKPGTRVVIRSIFVPYPRSQGG